MTPPERSKRLHNFTLPYLRWGHQRFLRCVKLQHPSPPPSPLPPSLPLLDLSADRNAGSNFGRRFGSCCEIGGGAGPGTREEKLGFDLRFARKVNVSAVIGGASNDIVVVRPWNLRTSRAACYEPREEQPKLVHSPWRHDDAVKRGNKDGDDGYKEKKEKVKFSVSLLREEIEEDFAAMIGKRPPRRPKKRPRIVQKQLNSLFPGLWLTEEVTADSYNVPEIAET